MSALWKQQHRARPDVLHEVAFERRAQRDAILETNIPECQLHGNWTLNPAPAVLSD